MARKTIEELVKKIKFLRTQGFSIPEISKEIGVSKTTAFRYTHGVNVLPKFKKTLISKRGGSKKRKQIKEDEALEEAKKLIEELNNKEKLLFLSALYWGKGSKRDFGLSNTDPNLIKVFVAVLKQVLGIAQDRLSVSVRIYEDLDRERCLSFWSKIVGIPKEKFVSVNILNGKKKGKLLYGMCRVRVKRGADILKKLNAVNNVVVNTLSP